MGRRSERLEKQGDSPPDDDGDMIRVVARVFDILRCFDSHEARLGNLEIANRCNLPRSTVSRLTHTLTRIGQLVYLPQDQKYRLGLGAMALSAAMLRGLEFRGVVRMLLRDAAERIPGTFGLVVPDRFDLVYLEHARTYEAVGLHAVTGTRISIARTAAGQAYTAALSPQTCEALAARMERDLPHEAKHLHARIAANRRSLRTYGYVISCGLWNPYINGISVPLWSPQYRDFLVLTLGLLAAMYDEKRLRKEVAPQLLSLAQAIVDVPDSVEGNPFIGPDAGLIFVPATAAKIDNKKIRSGGYV
jgi:DNA-binding IclR family transcriptional regulator